MFEIFENDPIDLFQQWMGEAIAHETNDPEAAALATVSTDGQPNVRMVLIKQVNETGFTFFTNSQSQKGLELADNPKVALCYHWKSLLRQIRVRGSVIKVADDVSDTYFNSRHPQSRRGAIASLQSQPLESRQFLLDQVGDLETFYPDDTSIPRPAHWHGYCVIPHEIEFWQQGENRLHDRFLYKRDGNGWTKERLYP